jgi:hypothetical protein
MLKAKSVYDIVGIEREAQFGAYLQQPPAAAQEPAPVTTKSRVKKPRKGKLPQMNEEIPGATPGAEKQDQGLGLYEPLGQDTDVAEPQAETSTATPAGADRQLGERTAGEWAQHYGISVEQLDKIMELIGQGKLDGNTWDQLQNPYQKKKVLDYVDQQLGTSTTDQPNDAVGGFDEQASRPRTEPDVEDGTVEQQPVPPQADLVSRVDADMDQQPSRTRNEADVEDNTVAPAPAPATGGGGAGGGAAQPAQTSQNVQSALQSLMQQAMQFAQLHNQQMALYNPAIQHLNQLSQSYQPKAGDEKHVKTIDDLRSRLQKAIVDEAEDNATLQYLGTQINNLAQAFGFQPGAAPQRQPTYPGVQQPGQQPGAAPPAPGGTAPGTPGGPQNPGWWQHYNPFSAYNRGRRQKIRERKPAKPDYYNMGYNAYAKAGYPILTARSSSAGKMLEG